MAECGCAAIVGLSLAAAGYPHARGKLQQLGQKKDAEPAAPHGSSDGQEVPLQEAAAKVAECEARVVELQGRLCVAEERFSELAELREQLELERQQALQHQQARDEEIQRLSDEIGRREARWSEQERELESLRLQCMYHEEGRSAGTEFMSGDTLAGVEIQRLHGEIERLEARCDEQERELESLHLENESYVQRHSPGRPDLLPSEDTFSQVGAVGGVCRDVGRPIDEESAEDLEEDEFDTDDGQQEAGRDVVGPIMEEREEDLEELDADDGQQDGRACARVHLEQALVQAEAKAAKFEERARLLAMDLEKAREQAATGASSRVEALQQRAARAEGRADALAQRIKELCARRGDERELHRIPEHSPTPAGEDPEAAVEEDPISKVCSQRWGASPRTSRLSQVEFKAVRQRLAAAEARATAAEAAQKRAQRDALAAHAAQEAADVEKRALHNEIDSLREKERQRMMALEPSKGEGNGHLSAENHVLRRQLVQTWRQIREQVTESEEERTAFLAGLGQGGASAQTSCDGEWRPLTPPRRRLPRMSAPMAVQSGCSVPVSSGTGTCSTAATTPVNSGVVAMPPEQAKLAAGCGPRSWHAAAAPPGSKLNAQTFLQASPSPSRASRVPIASQAPVRAPTAPGELQPTQL